MAAFDYADLRTDADELIEEFGQTVSVRRTTNSGTAWEPTRTPADYATKGAKVEFTWAQRQDPDVLASDQRWLVAAGPLTTLGITDITPADRLVVGAVAYEIVKVEPIAPAGIAVVFDCQIRT